MRTSPTSVSVTCAAVVALAFGVGRVTALSRAPAQSVQSSGTHTIAEDVSVAPTTMPLPADPSAITAARFDDAMRMLSGASPEKLKEFVDQLERISAASRRGAAIGAFFKTLIQIDSAAVRRLILELKDENRWAAVGAIRKAAPPRAMKSVTEVLLSFDHAEISGCSYDFLADAINEWSQTDPVAVMQFLDERSGLRDRYAATLVRNWAAYDPVSAREFATQQLERLSQREGRNVYSSEGAEGDIVQSWVLGYLEHDRPAALDYLLTSEPGTVGAAIPAVVAALFKDSPDEARAFVLRLPPAQQADALYAMGQVADRVILNDADDQIRSPEFIASWMLQFPVELWSEHISGVIQEWRFKDTLGLFAWLSDLPPEAQEVAAASAGAPYLPPEGAEKEFEMVMNVTNVNVRDQLLRQLMQAANEVGPAMTAALERADLPLALKQELAGLVPEQIKVIRASEDDE